MSIEVKIPALGESISSGILSSWKVADGSYVEIDQPIYELETDKITQEGLAEATGVITFLSKEGDEVEIGSAIARIDDTAEKPAGDAEPAEKMKKLRKRMPGKKRVRVRRCGAKRVEAPPLPRRRRRKVT